MRKPHPDFDVFEFMQKLNRSRTKVAKEMRSHAKDKDYDRATECLHYLEDVDFFLKRLAHQARTGRDL